MAQNQTPDEDLRRVYAVYLEEDENQSATARRMGMNRRTVGYWLKSYNERGLTLEPSFKSAELPPDDIPTDEIIDLMCKRFDARKARADAEHWQEIKINTDGPIGIAWLGDPHVDDDGCNWPLLKRDCEIIKNTEGMFGANIGDTTNNWVGSLMRLFSKQDTSQKTAQKLAHWLLCESGIEWILWLIGNHDEWNDGGTILQGMNVNRVVMRDWAAKIKLVFPNGKEAKIDAAHNHKGNSQWNPLHGQTKAARLDSNGAHLYIAGHLHNWALQQHENAGLGITQWLARCRGYKFIDDYAMKLGHAEQQEGATITAIFDPYSETSSGFLQCFADVKEASEYLKWKREQWKTLNT